MKTEKWALQEAMERVSKLGQKNSEQQSTTTAPKTSTTMKESKDGVL